MSENSFGFKFSPGHMRIIRALIKQDKRFTQLKGEARINATSLSQYLKQLTGRRIVEKDPETRRYHLPKALQPLNPQSYPAGWKDMATLIEDVKFYIDVIGGLKHLEEKEAALKDFLHIHLPAMAGVSAMIINEACGYDDVDAADEFIQRSCEFIFTSWIRLLGLLCFDNKKISEKPLDEVAKAFMEDGTRRLEVFLNRFPTEREAEKQPLDPGKATNLEKVKDDG